MSNGIYTALSGAVLKENQLELVSQNLSNSNSLAFKKMKMVFKDYLSNPESEQSGNIMTELSNISVDFSNGQITPTGNPFDLALEGSGFFALEGSQYTRRGDFTKSPEGFLMTKSGTKVLGKNGPILLPPGVLEIGVNGEVIVGKAIIDNLKLVDFQDKKVLTRLSGDLYQTDQTGVPAKSLVRQNALEGSNVDLFAEMVQIITTTREFQALQKAMQNFDDLTSKMNEVARI